MVQVPVAQNILQEAEFQTGEEFTHLSYTAVTSDPEKFVESGYKLRAQRYQRKIRIALVCTSKSSFLIISVQVSLTL